MAEVDDQMDEAPGGSDPPVTPPKIVLKDEHALRDLKAKTKRLAKVTLNHRTAGGEMVQLRQGKHCMIPVLAIEDMKRSGLIH